MTKRLGIFGVGSVVPGDIERPIITLQTNPRTGAFATMAIHTMVDAALGFVPTEYGPWFVHFPPTPISRFHTLLIKWGVMVLTANIVAVIFLIIAVGITGLSVLAAIGSAGLLVNLILFIILGLPSSGGTVPIEATPKYFGWLAQFEPMHQVFLGVRAILYFDNNFSAGLSRGVWMAVLGLAVGLVFGTVITRYYDRRGLHRGAAAAPAAA